MAQPALKGIESAAYRTLEEWVRITLEAGPVPPKEAAAAVTSAKLEELTPKTITDRTPSTFGSERGLGDTW